MVQLRSNALMAKTFSLHSVSSIRIPSKKFPVIFWYLDQALCFTWYDRQSPGMKNWILVANPSTTSLTAVLIQIGSDACNYNIGPGARITSTFPGYMGGPVTVTSNPVAFYASQRVFCKDSFDEV